MPFEIAVEIRRIRKLKRLAYLQGCLALRQQELCPLDGSLVDPAHGAFPTGGFHNCRKVVGRYPKLIGIERNPAALRAPGVDGFNEPGEQFVRPQAFLLWDGAFNHQYFGEKCLGKGLDIIVCFLA